MSVIDGKVEALRRAFDASFALPPPAPSEEACDLLMIRAAGDPYALRLRDVTRLVARCAITPIPAAAPHFLGLAGIRGAIVPVFDLAAILGHPPAPEAPPWLVLCGEGEPLALAFAAFDGHLRLPASLLRADDGARGARRYASDVASTPLGARPVLDLSLVATTIRDRLGRPRALREQ